MIKLFSRIFWGDDKDTTTASPAPEPAADPSDTAEQEPQPNPTTWAEIRQAKFKYIEMDRLKAATQNNNEAFCYVERCLRQRFWPGDYGDITEEEAKANAEAMAKGRGVIKAIYPAYGTVLFLIVKQPVCVEMHFDADTFDRCNMNNDNYIILRYIDEQPTA